MSNSFLDSCPAFFKVYLPRSCSRRLQIPPQFESHIKGNFPQASTIVCSRGVKWSVKIQRSKDDDGDPGLFFEDGWSKFVQDNALEVGEFLLFYYDKPNSSFIVKLFSRSCCERKSKGNALGNPVRSSDAKASDEDEEDVGNDNVKLNGKRKAPGSPDGCSPNNALEKASRYKPEHPFFQVVLCMTYIKRCFLHIPTSFCESYIEGKSQAELEYSGKTWKVKIYFQTAYRIGQGWAEFVKCNELQVGDVCVFELLDSATPVFKVTIFRSN